MISRTLPDNSLSSSMIVTTKGLERPEWFFAAGSNCWEPVLMQMADCVDQVLLSEDRGQCSTRKGQKRFAS